MRFELSPRFVERNPHGNTGIRIEVVHDLFPLLAVVGLRFRAAFPFGPVEILLHLPLRTAVAAGHVLPYHDPVTIAKSIPTSRLHLDVLADHVESEVFRLDHIVFERFVGRGRIQAVGPPALVERAEMENILVIELQPHDSVGIAGGRILTHRCIAVHSIDLLAV